MVAVLDLRRLQVLKSVLDTGSITEAAHTLDSGSSARKGVGVQLPPSRTHLWPGPPTGCQCERAL